MITKPVLDRVTDGKIPSVPTSLGRNDLANLFVAFQKARVRIDPIFATFMGGSDKHYSTMEEFSFVLYQTTMETNWNRTIEMLYSRSLEGYQAVVFATLRYLGGFGSPFLYIPPGEEEVNLILGYTLIDKVKHVLYVEHGFEHEKEEIRLHARPASRRWGNDTPMVMVVRV